MVYDYEVLTPEETFYKSIIDIDTQEFETNNLNSPVVKVEPDSDRALYIKISDKNKCYRSAFNWTDWFYNLNALETHKDDIICDRTSVIEKLIECFNEQIKSLRITRMLLEKWWYGSQIVDEYLKGIFGSNEKYEFAKKMRDQFQKAVCRHPLEWDKTLFNCKKIEDSYFDITHTHLREHVKRKLVNESEQSDIWEGALDKLFKKNDFYFVNPLYFAHHLDKAEVFGFNPYEGKTIKPRHPGSVITNDCLEHHNTGIRVLSNPGFAPAVTNASDLTRYPFKYNGLYYGTVNWCYHCSVYYAEEGKSHTGVDLAGADGTPIYSFIQGTVWATSYIGNKINGYDKGGRSYGRVMLIKGNNDRLYLLAHLSEYKKAAGDSVVPGEVVAHVGNSGGSKGGHLHLEVFECNDDVKKEQIINTDANENIEMKWAERRERWDRTDKRVNPFNHTEH